MALASLLGAAKSVMYVFHAYRVCLSNRCIELFHKGERRHQ